MYRRICGFEELLMMIVFSRARAGLVPAGGRTLLAKVLSTRAPEPEVRALVGAKHTRDEWVAYLREHGKALPGVQALKEKELLTLADYMSFNLPLPAAKVPANAA